MRKNIAWLIAGLVLLNLGITPLLEAKQNNTVILAMTTSIRDTGLSDVLMDRFGGKTKLIVKPIAVGTGQAIQLGRQGEADILWVHSPEDEKKFVEEGFGTNRTTFMHNDFVLLGPATDPAGIKGLGNIVEAFQKISQSKALFISRSDKSGTHTKELSIWKEAGSMPEKNVYIETGQGMAATVRVANEKQGYCLADRSSYLSLKKSLELTIMSEGDQKLKNYYSLILVSPNKFPKVNVKGAKALLNFLLSQEAKEIIDNFGKEKYGQQLFYYDFVPEKSK